ncbi:hypothetical protein JRQ81_016853 [Phrynocephalus forsythii]|uniref:Uncharacterized protein n=1 Tax=Phrynocephalus forsythii TaxID=171643 RepID=A0A9Q0XWC2_9SAUR|nr:hypothetical protein JRQ81_016853 [Phrynocephalus forsythii]
MRSNYFERNKTKEKQAQKPVACVAEVQAEEEETMEISLQADKVILPLAGSIFEQTAQAGATGTLPAPAKRNPGVRDSHCLPRLSPCLASSLP